MQTITVWNTTVIALLYVTHETAICYNLLVINNFYRRWKKKLDRSIIDRHLSIYQKGAYNSGIQIFNNLPLEIKIVADNQKKFKCALKKILCTYTFHTMEEYLTHS